MKTIGILGAGQLARMLALAGYPLGLQFKLLDPSADSCGGHVAPLTVADYSETETLKNWAESVDVITFDFENVPANALSQLEHPAIFPAVEALSVAQDRLSEKTLFQQLEIPVPAFQAVNSLEELQLAVETLGCPCIVKTRRLGYDGKGQFRIKTPADSVLAWEALAPAAETVGLIVEAFVPFQREISVIAVRNIHGEFKTWALTQNWHHDGVLSASLTPALVPLELKEKAVFYAKKIAEHLNYVGVFALELFVLENELLANEMAPRVHNSGHWSIEGAETSQFENHLRAVADLPLGNTASQGFSCMLNWLGELPSPVAILQTPYGHWHDYGKSSRAGRKVGHATFRADTPEQLIQALTEAHHSLQRSSQIQPVIDYLQEFYIKK